MAYRIQKTCGEYTADVRREILPGKYATYQNARRALRRLLKKYERTNAGERYVRTFWGMRGTVNDAQVDYFELVYDEPERRKRKVRRK